jgi:hypothetical protein
MVAGNNVHPDELDIDPLLHDGGNEDQMRLREIIDMDDKESVGSIEFEENDGDDVEAADEERDEDLDSIDPLDLVRHWSWNMEPAERYRSASLFMRKMAKVLQDLKPQVDNMVSSARLKRAQVGADVFKRADIIGATVVGASRRLETIRASEPFAIIVEEACEVMEPTLLSVLAVKSLRKLELIGDHRQLPAFVQNCWYNVGLTNPSIKTSLFERLVCNRNRDAKTFTILDEQRRMRKEIADISRHEYADLTIIKDHPHTKKQTIGDTANKSKEAELALHKPLWEGKGRFVPGFVDNIFFWNLHGNKESRPLAGLSACNATEAEAVIQLCKWLLLCGVPPSAITVITPYKGQKTLIISSLRKAGCLPSFKDNASSNVPMITVSTIDRYQGDENDIVILSLVKTQPGNMFVGLLNRFIVAVSRARLGFYIVGSVGAVVTQGGSDSAGPKHWRRFIDMLSNKRVAPPVMNMDDVFAMASPEKNFSDSDTEKQHDDDDVADQPEVAVHQEQSSHGINESLPICCPRHRNSRIMINDLSNFPTLAKWDEFCHEICPKKLDGCGHPCKLLCHSPVLQPHTPMCLEAVPRPCEQHAHIELQCHVARGKHKSLTKGLENFKCEVPMNYRRSECEHVVRMTCWEYDELLSGRAKLADCLEIVDDFVMSCGHVIKKPRCIDRRNYEVTPPACGVMVQHVRSCRCKVEMTCSEAIREAYSPTLCKASRGMDRPRCFHKISVRCDQGTALTNWWIENNYMSAERIGMVTNNTAMIAVRHGSRYGPRESVYNAKIKPCDVLVKFINHCGHELGDIPCDKAFKLALNEIDTIHCEKMVDCQNPLCRHNISVPCWSASIITSWEPWGINGIPRIDMAGSISVLEQLTNDGVPYLDPQIKSILRDSCKGQVRIRRSCDPSHIIALSCGDFLNYMSGKVTLPPCEQLVDRNLHCGHVLPVKCCLRHEAPPECREQIDDEYCYSCGVHKVRPGVCSRYQLLVQTSPPCVELVECRRYRCHHVAKVACCHRESLEKTSPGMRLPFPSDWLGEEINPPIVDADSNYCHEVSNASDCSVLVSYRQRCGHIVSNVKCCDAFRMSADQLPSPACQEIVTMSSPLCGHDINLPCSKLSTMELYDPWTGDMPEVEEIVDQVFAEGEASTCPVIRENFRRPAPPLRELQSYLQCQYQVLYVRECNHSLRTSCSSAYFSVHGNCRDQLSVLCKDCGFDNSIPCHKYTYQISRGLPILCNHEVMKLCQLCNINQAKVKCHEKQVRCNQRVSAALPCGHMVQWLCDDGANPLQGAYQCRGCVIPAWEAALTFSPNPEDIIPILQNRLTQLVQSKILNDCTILSNEAIDITELYAGHIEARHRIMENYLQLLKEDADVPVCEPPPLWDSDLDASNYHIICCTVSAKDDKDLKKMQAAKLLGKDTTFGHGFRLKNIFKSSDLEGLGATKDGSQYLLICAAYCYRPLLNSKPFVVDTGNNKQQARKKQQKFIAQGYDCCQLDKGDFLYWIAGSVLPLMKVHLRAQVQCKICLDFTPPSQGISCRENHFVCWECLQSSIQHAGGVDVVGRMTDASGNLLCSECAHPYYLNALASNKEVFDASLNLKIVIRERIAANEATKMENERMTKELQRIQRLSAEEQLIEFKRNDIIDNILTLRCPRCRYAFDDFVGCFALTCGITTCRAAFCAWCLADCGGNAHPHVRACPYNVGGDYYGTKEAFEAHHRRRRHRLALAEIQTLPSHKQNTLKQRMRRDFEDLGINIEAAP